MRLPFLQLESDIISHGAAEVSHLARCPTPQALGHICLVRAWAVSHASDETPPDGWVDGESAERRIEAAAHWSGERGVLVQALVDAGHARREQGGVRILHLEPYAKAWEQNRKSKERMRNARERSPNISRTPANAGSTDAERSAKFDGQTQTQTQTQKEERPSAVADASPVAQASLVDVAPTPTAKKPRKQADGPHAELWRALEGEYLRVVGHAYASGNAGADAAAVKWFREGAKVPEAETIRRWGNLLAWSRGGFPSVTGFSSLKQHWIAPQVVGVAGGRPVDDVGRGEDSEGECSGCGAHGREATGYLGRFGGGTLLGTRCGCTGEWQGTGLSYTDVAAWAHERRTRRVA